MNISSFLSSSDRMRASAILKKAGWWILFLTSSFYGIYAFSVGIVEILSFAGVPLEVKPRAVPLVFIVHALVGGIVLISGPLQFNRAILSKSPKLHRTIGRLYVYSVWITSLSAFWIAIFFDVGLAGKFAFGLLAVLWFCLTTTAYLRIRKRELREHREWMIRSFSLSFFFVTGGFWLPALLSAGLPRVAAYPLSVLLGWVPNLIFAELWIRKFGSSQSGRQPNK